MKILERLRDLPDGLRIERQHTSAYEISALEYESIEYEDPYSEGRDPLRDACLSNHAVDGLRRRIPDVHEEIPPEGYVISDQHENFDPQ